MSKSILENGFGISSAQYWKAVLPLSVTLLHNSPPSKNRKFIQIFIFHTFLYFSHNFCTTHPFSRREKEFKSSYISNISYILYISVTLCTTHLFPRSENEFQENSSYFQNNQRRPKGKLQVRIRLISLETSKLEFKSIWLKLLGTNWLPHEWI